MRVQSGRIVKIGDIGTPGKVIKVDNKGKAAVVEFDFPEGKVEGTIPMKIIFSVISRGALA